MRGVVYQHYAASISMTTLTQDPLATQDVTITITLRPDSDVLDERTALIAVGVSGEPPEFTSGAYAQRDDLIAELWASFGIHSTQRHTRTPTPAAPPTASAAPVSAQPSLKAAPTPSPAPMSTPDTSFFDLI